MKTRLGAFAAALSLAALVVLLAAGPGTRLGLWHFRTGLGLLRYALYLGGAGASLGLVALVANLGRAAGAVALLAGLAAVAVPVGFRRQAQSVPPIHDITTDAVDLPRYEALAKVDRTNPLTAPTAEEIAQQRSAYPDVQPLRLDEPPARAFDRVVSAARGLGWEIVAVDAARGHLEATDTTTWFGFKDDVVVRVRPDGSGSRIDVRSISRVGRSDVGANARRIRRFLEAVRG